MSSQTLVNTLQNEITGELMKAMGLAIDHWSKAPIHAVIRKGTHHFADICAKFDDNIKAFGVTQASRRLVLNFITGYHVTGSQYIPRSGPLLVTANHPGAADVPTILSALGRDDIKVVLSGVPFARKLPNAQQHFIHVTPDPVTRSLVIRQIIAHLKQAGSVFIFPTGHVTPDPRTTADASLVFEDWSQSIALILRRVPETYHQMTVVSGVIEDRFMHSPICKIRKVKWRQQILAEFMQLTWQMMKPGACHITPRISFIKAVTGQDLIERSATTDLDRRTALNNVILSRAADGLSEHLSIQNDSEYILLH